MIEVPIALALGVFAFAVALGALIAAWAAQPIADENRDKRGKPKRKRSPVRLPYSDCDDEVDEEEWIHQLDDDWMDEIDYYEQQHK